MNILPQDYKNHYISNKIFEIYYFFNVEKHFVKSDNNILIYTLRRNRGKSSNQSSLCYNITIQNYEFHGKRYLSYRDVLTDMWAFFKEE